MLLILFNHTLSDRLSSLSIIIIRYWQSGNENFFRLWILITEICDLIVCRPAFVSQLEATVSVTIDIPEFA
jgi:hypothetical protein